MQVAIAGIHMAFIWWPMLSLERAWMFAHLDTWANSHVFRVLSRGEHFLHYSTRSLLYSKNKPVFMYYHTVYANRKVL